MADFAMGRRIKTFDGHNINDDAIYRAHFEVTEGGVYDTYKGTPVETERMANFPVYVRTQPESLPFQIEIEILNLDQDYYDQLKSWFDPDPKKGQRYLVASDGNDVDQRLLCSVRQLAGGVAESTTIFHALLQASSPVWESNDEPTPDTEAVSVSGHTWTETNAGDTAAPMVITVTPNEAKAAGYLYRRQVTAASRSEVKAMDDPIGDGYPLELAEGLLNTATLEGDGKVIDSLDDLRIFQKSRELNRYPSPDTSDAATKLWVNANIPTRKVATLAADIDSMVEALEASDGFAGWLPEGHIIIGSEVLYYSDLTPSAMGTLVRGARNSNAAAHSAGDSIFWAPYTADIVYGDPDAVSPPAPLGRKPVLDLALSTNVYQVRSGPFYNAADRRSGAFQRIRIDDGSSVLHLRSYDDIANAALLFEDLLAAAGKPNANNAVLDFPVPIAAVADAVVLDFEVGVNLLLQAFVLDLDGNESRLITEFWSSGPQTAQTFGTANPLTRLRLNARIAAICGDLRLDDLSLLATTPEAMHVPAEIIAKIYTDPRVIVVSRDEFAVQGHLYAHFTLEKVTPIAGFVIYAGAAMSGGIANGNGDAPGDEGLASVAFGSTGLVAGFEPEEVSLPAGDYWMKFFTGSSIGIHSGRTEPAQWIGYHAQPEDIRALGLNEDAYSAIASLSLLHDNKLDISPIFAVLSRTAEPQSDAPLETGNTIAAKNLKVKLDPDRAPLIVLAGEEDLYPADFIFSNDTTGDFIHVFYLMTIGQSIEIDTEARLITDLATGLPILYALVDSSPEWPSLSPGSNTVSFTDPDLTDTDVTITFRDRFL